MILEFGALSRLTGDHTYEKAARKAMDYLWNQRNRASDLIGTILNIHSGDWVRRDSGVGAGVDSYYEYLLKAYILFGDDQYLKRFDRHYNGIMKYVSQGPLLVDVHMHRPTSNAKGFMDSLLAFWPGLQVLKGDLVPAIETHELLYQVMERHNYLMPEAFSISDFDVHWAMSLMRPEFVESTYFLYKSTGDAHYLDVGKNVLTAINKFSRSTCGFAAVKDVRTGSQEDRMDSFVLAETFKYLFLLFADPSDLVLNLEDFIFTTEAHLLPLSLSVVEVPANLTARASNVILSDDADAPLKELSTCPSNRYLTQRSYSQFRSPHDVRASLKGFVESSRRSLFGSASSCPSHIRHLKSKKLKLKVTAAEFSASNPQHLEAIRRMGIQAILLADGKIQLIQSTATAATEDDAEEGIMFMQEMIALSKEQLQKSQEDLRSVQFTSPKTGVKIALPAGTALFGVDVNDWGHGLYAPAVKIDPFHGCEVRPDHNHIRNVEGRIAIVRRGDCMFVQKARNCEKLGAAGVIVIDNDQESTASGSNMFSMSGDGSNDVTVPVLFLYGVEGTTLLDVVLKHPDLVIHMMPAPSSHTRTDSSSNTEQKSVRVTGEAPTGHANGNPESKHSHGDRRTALKKELEKITRLSDLLSNMEMIGKIIEIKDTVSDSLTESLLANLVHKTTGTIEEVVESSAAHANWVKFLKSIGFDDSLINSTINPLQDKDAFIAFVSGSKKRRQEA